ncbi:MAG: ABC transporter permease [Patescibacteria group bacterium]|jgi:putative ABC transport system permease protein
MLLGDLFSETYSAIISNKTRTGLTVLGIVIGIASVIAMVSIGAGAQSSIEENIQAIGSNLLMVTPSAQRGVGTQIRSGQGSAKTLTIEDADAIGNDVLGVEAVAAETSNRYQVKQKANNTNTSIIGVTSNYTIVRNIPVADGVFFTSAQNANAAKVAVLGPTTRDDLFGENSEDYLGKTIRINSIDFKVIGLTEAKGGSGFSNQDDRIYIPINTAQRLLTGDKSVSTISVSAADSKNLPVVQNNIQELLLKRHNITDLTAADFSILNQADIVATASSVTGTFTMLLAAIAGISLLVGGIGIMNMMLTTVTERTREIGLRKAIGAKRGDISWQFLTESVMITFLGGLFGVALGWGVSLIITKFFNVNTVVSYSSIFLAFCVSAGIGIIFGYYPARRAARLNPIDCLRYE